MAGTVALVTGGGSGTGQASSLACSWAGARVVVSDVPAEGGAETEWRIEMDGGEASSWLMSPTTIRLRR